MSAVEIPETEMPRRKRHKTRRSKKPSSKMQPANAKRKPIKEIFQSISSIEQSSNSPLEEVKSDVPTTQVAKGDPDIRRKELKEKIKEITVSYSFLEARYKGVQEQLEIAKAEVSKNESAKAELLESIKGKLQNIKALTAKHTEADSDVKELADKLRNKLIAKEKSEAETKELSIFLQNKENEYEELVSRKSIVKVDCSVQTLDAVIEEAKVITIKEISDLNKRTEEINAVAATKEKLLAQSHEKQEEIENATTKSQQQLDELRMAFRDLSNKNDLFRTPDKDVLFEIIKDKNHMEIKLEESHIHTAYYKVFALIIVLLFLFVGLFSFIAKYKIN